MKNKLEKQLNELEIEMQSVGASEYTTDAGDGHTRLQNVDQDLLLKWKVKVKNLLVKICGRESEQYKSFIEAENTLIWCDGLRKFNKLKAVFQATKEDFENGYLSSYKTIVQAEVFDTELEQAKELLKNGYHIAAAVIAGVVLETTLRELCNREKITIGKMNKMNDDLAKAGIYNALVQKQITALAGIRNSAAHGKTDEFNEINVEQMIAAIEQFLVTHLR